MPKKRVKYINRETLLKQRNIIFRYKAKTKEEEILIEGLKSLLALISEYKPGEAITFVIQ